MKKVISIAIICILIMSLIGSGVYFYLKNKKDNEPITYGNLIFNKTADANQYYYRSFISIDNPLNIMNVALLFENNPNELKSLPKLQNISFIEGKPVYISFNQTKDFCNESFPATYGLSSALTVLTPLIIKIDMNGSVKGAVSNWSLAVNGTEYVDCNNKTVNAILIQRGKENNFIKIDNCYIIEYKKGDVEKMTEKFQLDLLDYYAKQGKITNFNPELMTNSEQNTTINNSI